MNKLPTSVLVLAIIGIPWGALVACTGIMCAINFVHAFELHHFRYADVSFFITLSAGTLFLPISLLLIVAVVACFAKRAWARRAMLTYAWISLGQALLYAIPPAIFILDRPAYLGAPSPTRLLLRLLLRLAIGTSVLLIHPLCVLIFFTRPHVRRAFDPTYIPPGVSNFPVLPPTNQPP
jgi:hypothetical protein